MPNCLSSKIICYVVYRSATLRQRTQVQGQTSDFDFSDLQITLTAIWRPRNPRPGQSPILPIHCCGYAIACSANGLLDLMFLDSRGRLRYIRQAAPRNGRSFCFTLFLRTCLPYKGTFKTKWRIKIALYFSDQLVAYHKYAKWSQHYNSIVEMNILSLKNILIPCNNT